MRLLVAAGSDLSGSMPSGRARGVRPLTVFRHFLPENNIFLNLVSRQVLQIVRIQENTIALSSGIINALRCSPRVGEGDIVKKIYDVFERLPEGPLWMQAVEGMEEARQLVTFLHSKHNGSYFVYDAARAEVVAESSPIPLSSVRLAQGDHQSRSFNPNGTQ